MAIIIEGVLIMQVFLCLLIKCIPIDCWKSIIVHCASVVETRILVCIHRTRIQIIAMLGELSWPIHISALCEERLALELVEAAVGLSVGLWQAAGPTLRAGRRRVCRASAPAEVGAPPRPEAAQEEDQRAAQ